MLGLGCSDSGPAKDASVDRKLVDRGVDAAADLSADLVADLSGADGKGESKPGDLRLEAKVVDAKADAKAKDLAGDVSQAPLHGVVTRSVAPMGDGKGILYIGVYIIGLPLQVAGTNLTVDLSQPGSQVSYDLWGAPAGNYNIIAFLDDNGNATPFPLLVADAGDLGMSKPLTVAITGASQQVDLVLDKVEGAPVDGGVGDAATIGALKGKVTSSVTPSGDGKGALYVSIHTAVPPAGLVTSTVVGNADLSSPYSSETYFLGSVPAGSYYLQVWLDDNSNYNIFAPGPDKGDLVQAKPQQLHIDGGLINVQDVVLDKVQP